MQNLKLKSCFHLAFERVQQYGNNRIETLYEKKESERGETIRLVYIQLATVSVRSCVTSCQLNGE